MAYFRTNVLDNQIKALPTIDTASGSIATFTTDKAENLVNLEVAINNATEVNIIHRSRNLLENEATSGTVGTITFTVNADKSITVNGSTTTQRLFRVHTDFSYNDNLILSGIPSGSGLALNVVGLGSDTGSGFAFNGATPRNIQIVVSANTTVDNVTIYPMVRLASDTNTDYEEYYSQSYNIDLDGSVTDGEFNVISGVLTINDTTPPTTKQLDSIQIQTIANSVNNIYADTGDIIDLKFVLSVGSYVNQNV